MKHVSLLISLLLVLFTSCLFQACGSDSFKNATCTTTGPFTLTCVCNSGYWGDGSICKPIESCSTNNGGCSANATCTNTDPGTVICTCKTGYSGDGITCTPNYYQLTVTSGNGGTITVPPSNSITVPYGVAVNITATPYTHYHLLDWTETTNTGVTFGNVNSATTTVTLTGTGGDATIQANFIQLIITVAGNGADGYSGDNGPATSAELYFPYGVAVDFSGNLYIADTYNNRIRKVDTSGIITTAAGGGTAGLSDNGPATSAELYQPSGVAVDSSGNLYITDGGRIRKVDTTGIITTVAGNGNGGYSGDNGPATSAGLSANGVAVDTSGNIYIVEKYNYRIRKVDTFGIITTVAGNGSWGYSGDNGPAISAELSYPSGVAIDSLGNIYIADQLNYRVRKVNSSGIITTVAGIGWPGYSGDNGPATSAELFEPAGVAVDSSGNLYIADSDNFRIRKVDTSGTITTVAGTGSYFGPTKNDGAATSAELNTPYSVAVDFLGNLFIADTYNHLIREVY